MKIAVIGWGSLIWNPGNLQIVSEWKNDGPVLPIEFARESADGRMTLVLVEDSKKSPTLWAMLSANDLITAKDELAAREGIPEKYIRNSIGYWDSESGAFHGKWAGEISRWALKKGLGGVVWTNLKYGFRHSRNAIPTSEEILFHLNKLSPQQMRAAEEYVRKAPKQIRTEIRNELESKLGWWPDQC